MTSIIGKSARAFACAISVVFAIVTAACGASSTTAPSVDPPAATTGPLATVSVQSVTPTTAATSVGQMAEVVFSVTNPCVQGRTLTVTTQKIGTGFDSTSPVVDTRSNEAAVCAPIPIDLKYSWAVAGDKTYTVSITETGGDLAAMHAAVASQTITVK